MDKKNLTDVLTGKLFQVPDYQRGYAWEDKQLKDFAQDIDALIDDKIVSHYTGTIVIYQPMSKLTENYGTKKLEIVDIVDGQQRLTTCSLYLSIILNRIIDLGYEDYRAELSTFLYSGSKSKLRLNNDTSDFYYDLITIGKPNVEAINVHQKRILYAHDYLQKYLEKQCKARSNEIDYLRDLFDAIIRKLSFSFYHIEVESEIGMTFELMNSRGKDLSSLELLKNYLMYWVYRNILNASDKEDFTKIINKSWKEVFTNISKCNGSENQCLRIAWIFYHNHSPKNWKGYSGFKDNDVIPLRDFSFRSKDETKSFIRKFTTGLAVISSHYSDIVKEENIGIYKEEDKWINKIKNAGNIANFLPLMIAARIQFYDNSISLETYIQLLQALEKYSYKVFLWAGKRSNTGLSAFYKWGYELFAENADITNIVDEIYGLNEWYIKENDFKAEIKDYFGWYWYKRLLKYTLYEYELHLLEAEGKQQSPSLSFEDISDATIEHILPQTPTSNWKKIWTKEDISLFQHDISNLVLTRDNSRYRNFDFQVKRGKAGHPYCYANSDIRQERKISYFTVWTPGTCKKRRKELEAWISDRWGINHSIITPQIVNEEEDVEIEESLMNY